MKKICFILNIILIFSIVLSSSVYASNTIDTAISGADSFIQKGETTESKVNIKGDIVKNISDSIYNVLFIIGTIIAVIIGAVLGIQFILGSTEGKAEVKEKLTPYIIGCVIVFASFTIWKIAILLFSNL